MHSYTLVDYTNFPDNFNFQILKNQLRSRKKFDYENKNKYYIKIRTTDFGGLYYEALFEIFVNDLPEAKIILSNSKIKANSPPGSLVGFLTIENPFKG